MKKFVALCMAGIMLMSSPVFAEGIIYNGEAVSYSSQQPVIINSRTYVPIRDVFERLGYKVEWNQDTKVVNISNDYYNIMLTTATSKLIVVDTYFDITSKKLDNPVQLINGRTMLPLREILEKANYELVWDAETKTTTIKDNNDYAALKAQTDKLKRIEENIDSLEYKVDTAKPVGKLTAEEKAYLENLYTVLSGEKYSEADTNVDGLTPEQARKVADEFVNMVIADIKSVECPDSLKAVESAAEATFKGLSNKVVNLSQLENLLDGEVDQVKNELGLALTMVAMVGIPISMYDIQDSLNSFYEAGNLDPEAELGEYYKPADSIME